MKICKKLITLLIATNASIGLAAPLISSQEAALPASPDSFATRGISRGPVIKLNSPEATMAVTSPFDLRVTFEPRGDAKIDQKSIQVVYLKTPSVDLTPRLKGAITKSGIDLQKAEVPPGTHAIRVSVKDSEGHETKSVYTLVVNK